MKNFIVIIFFLAFFSCKSDGNDKSNYGFKLIVRGPTECVYNILIKENGDGLMIKGKSNDFYRHPFKSYSEIVYKKKFKINSKQKLDTLLAVIDNVSNSPLNKGGFYSDSPRKQLYLKGELKIDVYSIKSKEINEIIKLIEPSLPSKIQYVCD